MSMFPPSTAIMDNHQDLLKTKFEIDDDPLLSGNNNNNEAWDNSFNDSGGDFFEKFLVNNNNSGEGAGNSNDNSNNMSSSSFNMNMADLNGTNNKDQKGDSATVAENLLQAALDKSHDSLQVDGVDDKEMSSVMEEETSDNIRGMTKTASFHPVDEPTKSHAWEGLTSGGGSGSSGMQNATFQNAAMGKTGSNTNKLLNSTLGAKPLNVSLGIASTLRKKGTGTKGAGRVSSVHKSNMTAAKLRSTMSDGMLARALKARYNSQPYNMNRTANAPGVVSAKIPRNAVSSVGLRIQGGAGASGLTQIPSGSMFGSAANGLNSQKELLEEQEQRLGGGGSQNASWGGPPAKRKPSSNSLFSKMLSSTTQTLLSQKNQPKIGSANSRMSLLKSKKMSSQSMHDLLRLSKKQTKTQSLLRQSSAHSLLKQTSSQSLKDLSKRVDVSKYLPPSHASPHVASRKGQPGSQNNIETSSLLHQSCRLYPTTAAVVESALRIDPEAVRRTVPVTSDGKRQSKPKLQEIYAFPVNIAIKHDASMEVLKLLVQAGPDVLAKKDGTDAAGSLSIALMHKCDFKVVDLLVSANPSCVKIPDRRANYPLHIAIANGASLDVVKRLYSAYPQALKMRNFHSDTPLDIAQRSTLCPEQVMNFLQSTAFSPLEDVAFHMDNQGTHGANDLEEGLDDIMETNL